MNVSLYHGERVLRPENLILQRRKYLSLANSYGETERDVLMKDVSQNIYYGIEIETESDYGMPERVLAYDTCEYEYQMKESDFLLPMVTVVLYLKEGRWEGRRKLSQMFRVESKELLGENLHDYDFPLIERVCGSWQTSILLMEKNHNHGVEAEPGKRFQSMFESLNQSSINRLLCVWTLFRTMKMQLQSFERSPHYGNSFRRKTQSPAKSKKHITGKTGAVPEYILSGSE